MSKVYSWLDQVPRIKGKSYVRYSNISYKTDEIVYCFSDNLMMWYSKVNKKFTYWNEDECTEISREQFKKELKNE